MLALFGLALAVYTVLPVERKLELRMQFDLLNGTLAVTALVLVHWILLFPVLQAVGVPSLGYWCCGFTPELASYAIIAFAGSVVAARARWGRLALRRIPLFHERVERLLQSSQFTELEFLLERHLDALASAAQGERGIQKVRRKLQPSKGFTLILDPATMSERESEKRAANRFLDRLRSAITRQLPAYEEAQSAATITLDRLLTHEPFVAELAKGNPYLGLKILESGVYASTTFQDYWIAALLKNPDSRLYSEVEKNQFQRRGWHRYEFEPQHRILFFYCSEPERAKDFQIAASPAKYAYYLLDDLQKEPSVDPYNQSLGYFEDECWKDPIHAVIRFFDLFVSEAVHKGIRFHGWLDYPRSLIRRFEKNLDLSSEISHEFPTRYHFLIYEVVAFLRNCYVASGSLSSSNPNRQVESPTMNLDEGYSLTKALGLYLGEVYRILLLSGKLSVIFKAQMLELSLRHLEDQYQNLPDANRKFLLEAIAFGGFDMLGAEERPRYQVELRECIHSIDDRLRFSIGRELQELLDELTP